MSNDQLLFVLLIHVIGIKTDSLSCEGVFFNTFVLTVLREKQMNSAFQQESGQSDSGRCERFG